jgi:hypothetical protein
MANDKDKTGGVNPMVASLAGAALGAAVGAGAVILSDKKNRQKLEKALEGLKKQGFDVLEIVQKEAQNVRKQIGGADETAEKRPAKKSGTKKK